ncbi:hypothetical protein NA8A_17123 [Nitratireductor indicus C115]|uniref:Uncharacterized protein n=2 Tax=Nitratireductor indicus TaxID=721133 RepID=K2P1J6_9HYPH|nr:hypothetical protein NA8A_17123 [Nitratireductor indicus C115]SFQ64983.1 hypothetical protein SAMN05216176_108199 [Nitratireductor indicus]
MEQVKREECMSAQAALMRRMARNNRWSSDRLYRAVLFDSAVKPPPRDEFHTGFGVPLRGEEMIGFQLDGER